MVRSDPGDNAGAAVPLSLLDSLSFIDFKNYHATVELYPLDTVPIRFICYKLKRTLPDCQSSMEIRTSFGFEDPRAHLAFSTA